MDDIHDTYDGCIMMHILGSRLCFFTTANGYCSVFSLQLFVEQSLLMSPLVMHLHCIYLVRMACLAGGLQKFMQQRPGDFMRRARKGVPPEYRAEACTTTETSRR